MDVNGSETAEVVAHANELAWRFEDYVPAEEDRENVSAVTRARLAALRTPDR
jgi:hypothetical protein